MPSIGFTHRTNNSHPPDFFVWCKTQRLLASTVRCLPIIFVHGDPRRAKQGTHGHGSARLQAPNMTIGVISAPGDRYHPAIIAQAAATLAEMLPRRTWLALGSGERLNEDITALSWPDKTERNARFGECAGITAALFRGRLYRTMDA